MTVLIGFTGRMQSGKSTAAKMLAERGDFQVFSFAHPLKEMVSALLMCGFEYGRWSVDFYLAHKSLIVPDLGVSVRHLLQTLGTDWGRNMISRELWVRSASLQIDMDPDNAVFDDVRFEDEAAMIRERGGLIIHLQRNRQADYGLSHASEIGIAVGAKDVVIDNNGSSDDLLYAVNRAVDRFIKGSDELIDWCLTPCADYRV